jgi:hypothetical protein
MMKIEPYNEKEAKNGNDLLLEMAQVISNWAGLEYVICEIYLTFFQNNQRDVPAIAYHAIRTFDARLTVVDSLVGHFCDSKIVAKWGVLYKKIRACAADRNAVAHSIPIIFGVHPNRKWGIAPSPYNIKKFVLSQDENDYLTPKKLKEKRSAILALTKKLNTFRIEIELDPTLRSRLFVQQGGVPENSRLTQVVAHTWIEP